MNDYEIIPEQDKKLYLSPPPADPSKRRELKITQYKAEKSVRAAVEVILSNYNVLYTDHGLDQLIRIYNCNEENRQLALLDRRILTLLLD